MFYKLMKLLHSSLEIKVSFDRTFYTLQTYHQSFLNMKSTPEYIKKTREYSISRRQEWLIQSVKQIHLCGRFLYSWTLDKYASCRRLIEARNHRKLLYVLQQTPEGLLTNFKEDAYTVH